MIILTKRCLDTRRTEIKGINNNGILTYRLFCTFYFQRKFTTRSKAAKVICLTTKCSEPQKRKM